MKKILFTAVITLGLGVSQTYDVGDVMSTSHQNEGFDVCYGDYPSNTFRFGDLNGATNESGMYYISFVDMAATW